ncbi:unnamed protein product, partial [Staurois parvus]
MQSTLKCPVIPQQRWPLQHFGSCSLRMTSLPLDAFRHIRDLVIREI